MITFALNLPKLTKRTVWVGVYSEMTGTVVMLFSKRPKKCKALKHYSVLDENYLCSIWMQEFEFWFGSAVALQDAGLIVPHDHFDWVAATPDFESQKVVPIKLYAPWHNDQIVGLNLQADN